MSEKFTNYFDLSRTPPNHALSIMTANELHYKSKEIFLRKDKGAAIDLFSQYQASHCYHPIKINLYDSHTSTFVKRFVNCGTCYHCMETKINEWVTRMYAHLEDFKYAYFVTLTYRSITDAEHPVNQLLLNKLSQAVWHLDNFNERKHMSYNPCLLCKEHYQNFIKRLRKLTKDTKLTYVLSGELGKRYGRPHFHLILFSNTPISYEQVRKAWSICLWRTNSNVWKYRTSQTKDGTAFDFPIGRVDFHDLVSNGTINTTNKIKVDGTFMNAANCFAYVCKYVCKRDAVNYSRVRIAYDNLFYDEVMCNDPNFGSCPLGLSAEFCRVYGLDVLYNTLKLNSYEEKMPFVSLEIAGKINRVRVSSLYGQTFTKEYFPCEYIDFRKAFSPFVEFSRGTPIGSIFAKNHIEEFTQGVFNKPILQDSSFVVPSYFRNKAKEYVFGLRRIRKTIKSSSSYKGSLLDLYRRLESAQSDVETFTYSVLPWHTSKDYNALVRDTDRTLLDKYTGERIIFFSGRALYFKYDRSKRRFEKSRQIPLSIWINTQLTKLLQDFRDYRLTKKLSEQNLKARESAYMNFAKLGLTYRVLNERFCEQQETYFYRRQRLYDSLHLSVE